MSQPGGVSAEQLLRSLVRLKTRLPAEIGTFLILETCEQVLSSRPYELSLSTILISGDGVVTLGDATASDEETCARGLHRDLTSLLVASGPAPAPALMRLVEEGPRGNRWSLHQLRDDLEASLVPLNRNASRRVLSRFVREVQGDSRAMPRGAAQPTFQDLDSELSALLGDAAEPHAQPDREDEPTSPVSRESALPQEIKARERDATIREPVEELGDLNEELLGENDSLLRRSSGTHMKTTLDPMPPAAPRMTPMSAAPPPRKGAPVAIVRARSSASGPSLPPAPSMRPGQSKGGWLFLVFVGLTLALGVATYMVRPEVVDRLQGKPEAPIDKPKAEPSADPAPRAYDLTVSIEPERAQVLRLVGEGPVTVPHVALGVAHEFVAVMEGYAPTRLVVQPDAEWEQNGEGARLEVAMQLGPKAQGKAASLDVGPSQMPMQVGTARGTLGTVRIVTTPKGAKVYQLIGFAPEARVENLPLAETQELFAYHKGYVPQLRVVGPSDLVVQGAARPTANVAFKLVPSEKSR